MQQCLICIIDLLGTKGIWTEENAENYFRVIENVKLELTKWEVNFSSRISKELFEWDFISFSDTLVITLINKKRYDYFFHEFIEGFSQFILGVFQQYFAENFFARGAISFGEIDKRGNHFVGPAVDDAAEYFELPDMIGICLTPKTSLVMDNAVEWNLKFNNKRIDAHTIKYKTPLKNKIELDLYQINWIKHFIEQDKSDNDTLSPLATISLFLSKRNVPLVAVSKFTNTISFLKFVETRQ